MPAAGSTKERTPIDKRGVSVRQIKYGFTKEASYVRARQILKRRGVFAIIEV